MQINTDSSPFLSVIIPAYNEQDRILPTLENTLVYLRNQKYPSEIIVVSDGSRDDTARVAQSFQTSEQVSIRALEYHPNRGKGYAVRYGLLRGRGRILMFMDADYAVPVEYCERGLAMIDQGFDIAIASRAIEGAQIRQHQNSFRQLSAKIYTFIQNIYLGIHFPDTQCGFKFFTRRAAQSLFNLQKLDSVIFDPEILWLARKKGFRVGQFPVQWRHVEDSRIQYDNLGKSLFVFQELLRIKQLHRGPVPRHGK
ncbi:MAG: glycosyltransferase family 2 protein [Desulfobacteraceae bacterium]